MIEVTVEADFNPKRMGLSDGLSRTMELLKALTAIPAFASGWEADGAPLSDEAGFLEALQRAQAGEGADAGYHFAIAENARGLAAPFLPPESYLAEVSFDTQQGYLEVKLSLAQRVADFKTIRGVLQILIGWSELQHASATPAFYAPDDSPIDPVNRRGIGWIGWVPFAVSAGAVPEAGHLEPLGPGTLVASQTGYWDVTDRQAVKRAQALEMALNKLGALPTRDALARGGWGSAP